MQKKFFYVFYLAATFSFCDTLKAQPGFDENSTPATQSVSISSPSLVLLDLEGPSSFTISAAAPLNAGRPLDFTTAINNSVWINVSSVIGSVTKPRRDISVYISNGNLPNGFVLKATASNDAGQGGGRLGSPVGQITLTNSPQNIITNFGTCFTGDGVNKGYNITYALSFVGSYNTIKFDQGSVVTITYTISD